ncbi:MAG: thymidine phosphorylase, partial [Anaerolineae bacterium]
IRGFRSDLSVDEFKANLRQYGIVISGQTADMVPADGLLYALRDVTATVESLPLIASSIMSKKIAAGADAIVLDVKVGRGAFIKMEEEALVLAQMMVDIGHSVGRRVTAVISDMNQPLGRAVGNALEVVEALETLRGGGPTDFLEHCLAIAGQMLLLADRVRDLKEGREVLMETLRSGQALSKFKDLVVGQGGDGAVVDDPALLPRASIVREVVAPRSGYVAGIDAMEVGLTAVDLGAGRTVKGDSVDPAVGLVLHKKIGDYVKQNEALFTLHANHEGKFAAARERMLRAYTWTDTPPTVPPLIHSVIKE